MADAAVALKPDMTALATARNHRHSEAPQFAEQFIGGHLASYRFASSNQAPNGRRRMRDCLLRTAQTGGQGSVTFNLRGDSEQRDAERTRRVAQFGIERGQWQRRALRQFEIGRVVEGKAEAVGESKGGTPRLSVGMWIEGDVEQPQIA